MTNNRWLPALGMTAMALALTACGSGNSASNASVRIANATLTHPSIDLLVNGTTSITGDTTDTVSAYVTPSSGSVALQINDTSGTTAIYTAVPTLSSGAHYTVVAYEASGTVNTVLVTEDTVAPAAGVTTLRYLDAAPSAGKIDVYLTTATGTTACTTAANLTTLATSFGLLTAASASTKPTGAGTYTVCVFGSGSKTDLRMALPVTLTGATSATIVMTPASGGALLNGSFIVQQGAYTAARNTNTRVRLAHSVAGNPTVAASSSSGVTIDAGSASPWLDFTYATVPATDTLNITVGSASVAAPSGTLPLGGDVTLFVYGNGGTPVASLIVDDNQVPTDQTTANLRVINGLTGSVGQGTLTLTANNSPVGVNVPLDSAGTYATIAGSSVDASFPVAFAANFSTISGPLALSTASASQTLSVGTTYEVLVGGDVSAPVVLAR